MARSPSTGTPATVALTRAGVAYTVHGYEHDPAHTSYGLEAAERLGLDPGRVFKTLLASADGQLVVAVVPVSGQLDLKALAAVRGAKRAVLTDVLAAERATGYVVGGISPIGQKRALPSIVDTSALRHPTVFVSAGRRGSDLEIDPADLIRVVGATTARIGRSR